VNEDGTARYPNGTYTLTATAVAGGSAATSGPTTVEVDHTPRSVTLTQPTGGLVRGNVEVEAHATAALGEPLWGGVEVRVSGSASGNFWLAWSPEVQVWVPGEEPGGGHWETQYDETRYRGVWVTEEVDEAGNVLYPDGAYTWWSRTSGATRRTGSAG
jgi:hypothetical protein